VRLRLPIVNFQSGETLKPLTPSGATGPRAKAKPDAYQARGGPVAVAYRLTPLSTS
jgi:hypothetical protein